MLHHFFYIFEQYIYPSEISLYHSEISQAANGISSPLVCWASTIFLCLLDCILQVLVTDERTWDIPNLVNIPRININIFV